MGMLAILTYIAVCHCCAGVCLAVVPQSLPAIDAAMLKTKYEIIEAYFKDGFSYTEIVALLMSRHGIKLCLRQVKRVLKRLNLHRRGRDIYAPVECVIRAILGELSGSGQCVGYRSMWKRLLRDHNLLVKRKTVEDLMRIIDTNGVAVRRAHRLKRRLYATKGPNYLWHTDGYDKLKPLGFAIHGCIDGYSRRMIWLEVSSSNNNPAVITTYYLEALEQLGIAPRVLRFDCGTENVNLKFLQCFFRYNDTDSMARHKSFMSGKSTSNQRIERWWGILRQQGIDWWINLFKDLRDSNEYDPSNIMHKECLKYCFMSLLQADLDRIAIHWNKHSTRKQKCAEAQAGKPDVLYFCPNLYNSQSYGTPVDRHDIAMCKRLYGSDRLTCTAQFIELVEIIRPGTSIPTDLESAIELYFFSL